VETGTVYADVLALINFSMDFVALKITSSILRLKPGLMRSVAGALIGAAYSFAALFMGLHGYLQILTDVAAALIICFAVYGTSDVFRWLSASGTFFAVGFIMGGAMTALYSRAGGFSEYLSEGGNIMIAEGAVDGKTFALLCVLSAAATAVTGKVITCVRRKKCRTLVVECCGKSASLYCVCDSGNLATEPLSGLPVIFVGESAAGFLPRGVMRYLKTGDSGGCENKTSLCVVIAGTVDGRSVKYAARCEASDGGKRFGAALALSASVPDGADGIAPAVMPEKKKQTDRRSL